LRVVRHTITADGDVHGPDHVGEEDCREDGAYRDYRDRYRTMATDLGFEGHMAWAAAMP
jgi:hypothetical protein